MKKELLKITLRELRWPDDRDPILAIDTSFTTERVQRIFKNGTSFTMHEAAISPPLHKVYDLTDEIEDLPALDHVVIAERDKQVMGLAALTHDIADQRAIVRHIYVDRPFRGQGIGHALMDALLMRAEEWQVRYLWLETQDVNYDAINFYQKNGLEFCGLDLSLDVHNGSPTDETAVFFMRNLQ